MKVAILTDTHFGVRNDSAVLIENQKKFYDEIFFPSLIKENITTLIHLGDLVDRRKYINYVTLTKMREYFLDRLRDLNIKTYMVTGNHDTSFKNTNDVNSLGLLLKEYSNIEVFDIYPTQIKLGTLDIVLCPWLVSSNMAEALKFMKNTTAPYLMGHFEFMGYEMLKGTLCEHGLDRVDFQQYEQIFSGHFHHPSEHGNIKYLGAPYEMTWSDYRGKRGFHILDTETRKLTFVKNYFGLFHKLDYDDSDLTIEGLDTLKLDILKDTYVKIIVKNKTNPYLFDAFVDKVHLAEPVDVKIIDSSSIMIEENIDWSELPDSLSLMKKFIENNDSKTDTSKVIKELNSLWNEAQEI